MRSLALVLCLFGFNATAWSSDPQEFEITQFFIRTADALNSQDLPAIANSWSEQGEAFTLAGGIYKGRAEIEQFFSEAFAGPYKKAKFEFLLQNIRLIGPTQAAVDGVWKIRNAAVPANYPVCGIFLYTLSKKDATWRIDIAYSSVPRPGHTSEHGRTLSWVKACQD
jgi:uncharacterized protein (TIGR02246 family)